MDLDQPLFSDRLGLIRWVDAGRGWRPVFSIIRSPISWSRVS
ncbi:hypothetical protein [Novosphingobium barchaimii]|nr:hypothetical protein [Novosphingobium barchaimii]